MLKKIGIVIVGIALLAAGLYAAGYRWALDGTGKWPRFIYRPNPDALEADRARQRETMAAAGTLAAPATDTATPATKAAAAEAVPAIPVIQSSAGEAHETAAPGAVWTDFRGPRRDGRYTSTPIRTNWPAEGLPRLWKQPVGGGYASFVVADGRAFTIEQRRAQEVVAAYDINTGRELWTNGWSAFFQESMGGDGPRATPTYHEGRIYALGAEGELRVLSASDGSVVWRRNILNDNGASNLTWGMAASPLIVDDKLIVLPGGRRGKSVVAYDKSTGKPVWAALDDSQAYTSPMLVTIAGVRQILVVSGQRAVGLSVENGSLLWEYPWNTYSDINVAQPIVFQQNGKDRVFLSASYGTGAVVFEVTAASGSTNVNRFETRMIWANQRMKNKFSSSVLHNGFIYGLDESILACLDANTGEQKWKGGRYGYGQIMLAGNHIIVLTEDGELVLVNATPQAHQEVGRFQAIEGKTWNHPVIADGKLLVRNIQEMAAFDITPR